MTEDDRPSRFRFRLRTILFFVAILALLLVVIIQQVRIGHQQAQIKGMRQLIDAGEKERVKVITILREQRDWIERHR